MLKLHKSIKDKLIAESISEWTWEYDLVTGETNTAEQLVDFFGYNKNDISDNINFWFKLIHPDDTSNLKNALNMIITGKNDFFKAEFRVRSKHDGYKWVQSKGKAFKDTQGRNIYITGFSTDITQYKQAEESEWKYQTLFNNVNDMILLSPMNEDGTSREFIETNNMVSKLLGYSKLELLHMTSDDLYADKEYTKAYKHLCKEVMNEMKENRKGYYYTYEVNLIRKDGTILPVETNTNIFKFNEKFVKLCVIRDISERLKAEEELRKITERNKKIVDLSPLGVYICNDGLITYVNKPGLKLIGAKNQEEILGLPILDFVSPSYRESSAGRQVLIQNGFDVEPIEMELSKVDGTKLIGEVYSAPMSSKSSVFTLSYVKDITDQKKMIEENKKLLEQTIEYDRLKTEFFSNISHELRTPLNIILSSIQLLTSIYNNSSNNYTSFTMAFERYIGIMRQNGYRLLKLINNIIDLTRIDSGFLQINFCNQNIVEVVENITLSVADYIESKGINLIFDTNTEEKIIACDDDKIERIMLNLLSNAIKYTQLGGTIEVTVKDTRSNVMISVKDTGCGIPPDKLEVIFERFRQVDEVLTRKAEGSGIGLSLVKALVEAHGGTIKAYSTSGVGSEFIIFLPNKLVENDITYHKSLDIIDNKDQFEKKIERINIEFSDIYS